MVRFSSAAAALLASFLLAGCSSGGGTASGQPGNPISNLVFWGSPSVPPAPPLPEDDDFQCPSILVTAAAHRVGGGDRPRAQYSLGDVARECSNVRRDGAHMLKIGAEGRVLLGPGGSPGRYDVSVRFTVRSGERIIASRTQRQGVTVGAEGQGTFQMVESGIEVPGGLRDVEIEVGFAGAGEPAAGRRRAARR